MNDGNIISGSLFEDDYLLRTLGPLAHAPDIALTELVANAWDAGAENVQITIPDSIGEEIVISDDGTGLTREHFHHRWMRLGYNRLKHQGDSVLFPGGKSGHRLAFGRNGVGRHGLLCFNDEYTVVTTADGKTSCFTISTHSGQNPFVLKSENVEDGTGHGTTLSVQVKRHLPDPDKILNVISARFLHDPKFRITLNGQTVPLEKLSGHIDRRDVSVGDINLTLHFIDSTKSARSTLYQGIAFWQAGRLIGEPSWILGHNSLIDGRTKLAKRYTVVVSTTDLAQHIKEDWTGFIQSDKVLQVYSKVEEYVNEMFAHISSETLAETKASIYQEFKPQISNLSPLGRYEVDEAMDVIAHNHPTSRPEVYSIAVEAVINLEKTRNGKALLYKLSQLTEEDIAGLDKLLSDWSVKDALCVLDEIDRRISVIEAIKKLSDDKDVDELKVLHPLVTEARWLFGPEFDSPEYASNRQLVTVIDQVFGKKIDKTQFMNHKKRPDLVILQNGSSLAVTSTVGFDKQSKLSVVQHVLIIELKRGGFQLGRDERNQAQGYIEDLLGCGSLIGNPYVDAFVVGETISDKLAPTVNIKDKADTERAELHITTYGQLVDTAEKRLFNLRKHLGDRYDDVPGMDLYNRSTAQNLLQFDGIAT